MSAAYLALSSAPVPTCTPHGDTTFQSGVGLRPAASEAICLRDLVHATCIELRPWLAHHQVTLLLNGDAHNLPRVFGNRDQLRTALWECMEATIVHARLAVEPSRSLAMEISFSTDANHVHLTIRSLGAIEHVTLGGAAEDTLPDPLTEAGSHNPVTTDPHVRQQHIVFPFARVLLQSLGGQVAVNEAHGGGAACTVSLPGLSEVSRTQPIPEHHALVYAGLLTRLTSIDAPPQPLSIWRSPTPHAGSSLQ